MINRGADLVARTLAAAGVKHLFTLSGNHVMPVFDAALDAKLALVHVRHEAAAVHMADAWGRLTGEPGVALVTGGPGHANAVAALYTALAAQSPLILISGHAPLDELGRGAFQEMDQAAIAAPLAKASWVVRSAAELGTDLVKAWRTACAGIPGPVHVSIPNDVLDAAVNTAVPGADAFALAGSPPRRDAALDAALEALASGERPLIVAGPAAMREGLPAIEEATGIPAIGMESPRGVNDPALGRLAEVLLQADTALLLGKPLDFTLRFGRAFSSGCRLLHAPAMPGGWERLAWKKSGWLDDVRAALAWRPPQWRDVVSKEGGPLHPVELCRAVQGLLEHPQAVLVCDGGEFGQWAQACLAAPRRLINGPAGSIGSALPFAGAAKLAFPAAPVVAVLGDGTFGFHVAEIDTAVRCGLDYLAVVGNDATWNAEYQIQVRAYGEARAQGCELLPTRYGAAATALGAHGEDVRRPSELAPALAAAARPGRPAVINVLIERLPAPRY
ncbi:MAG TPA: thiamine pyrophosphate-binding protein [Burkholderiales bacterium]|nr:thiamine pyrophosphate-binding protein [Burkholderiales bacterium]